MNWSFGNPNQLQRDYWNDPNSGGMRALFQSLGDFYSNQGRNSPMAAFFNNMFGAEQNRYNLQAISHPGLMWDDYLQQRAPELMNMFGQLPPSLRGLQHGFVRPGREVW